jgi:peptide/nickel transport system permease protein
MAHSTEPRQPDAIPNPAAGAAGKAARLLSGSATGSAIALAEDEEVGRRLSRLVRLATLPWRALVAVYQDPRLLFGVLLLALALAAILAPLITSFDPLQYHPKDVAQPPSQTYPLGTDSLGRDVLTRVLYGARISLSVGLGSILIGGGIGTVFGLLAGYSGGWVDRLIGIIVDALLSFPDLILALGIAAALGASVVNLVIALAIVRIPVYARLARGQTLQVRSLQYVEAARAIGTTTPRMLVRHILPNIFSPLLVQATISISFAILGESVLSFLGLGAAVPTPEWGSMIAEAQPFISGRDPWMMLGPGLALCITVLSLNLFGDALRDRLDPRSADRGARPRAPRA